METSQLVGQVVALRRVREAVVDGVERRRLARVTRQLRRQLGAGVPKRQAAAVLGVSVQAVDRWVRAGRIPVLRRPGSSRELIDAEALLVLAEQVERLRGAGESKVLGKSIAMLDRDGRSLRRLRPNQPSAELRREFRQSTPAERLRQGVELSSLGASLAANARARNGQPR